MPAAAALAQADDVDDLKAIHVRHVAIEQRQCDPALRDADQGGLAAIAQLDRQATEPDQAADDVPRLPRTPCRERPGDPRMPRGPLNGPDQAS